MIPGLDRFREHFHGLESSYVLIGGTAAHLLLDEAGLAFRATKDLDIVLCVEALDEAFVAAFWSFVSLAGYERREVGTAPRRYYRFQRPSEPGYPAMLELFSRRIDGLDVPEGVHLTPVPVDEDLSSLSAILLDDRLYAWILEGRRTLADVPVVGAAEMVALKMRAFLDLSDRRNAGEVVDAKDIRKHRNDVLRLLQVVTAVPVDNTPEVVREDAARFAAMARVDHPDLRSLGLVFAGLEDALSVLEVLFGAVS